MLNTIKLLTLLIQYNTATVTTYNRDKERKRRHYGLVICTPPPPKKKKKKCIHRFKFSAVILSPPKPTDSALLAVKEQMKQVGGLLK